MSSGLTWSVFLFLKVLLVPLWRIDYPEKRVEVRRVITRLLKSFRQNMMVAWITAVKRKMRNMVKFRTYFEC